MKRKDLREPLISEHFKNLFLKMRTIRGSQKGNPRITKLFEVPLIKIIESLGYKFLRHGSNHDVYTNGTTNETIPRHNEINEVLAKCIIKRCGGK